MPFRSVAARPHRALTGSVALAVGAALLTSCVPEPSVGSDVYTRPASGVFTLSGHGWGHGRGMSQWGAQGAAGLGKSADEILAGYYPGTAKTVLANTNLRVLVGADDTVDTQVLPVAGLTATDGLNRTLQLPVGAKRWRVLADATGLHLQRLDVTWTTVPVAGAATLSSPVRFTSGTGVTTLVLPDGSTREYRGAPTAVRRSTGGLYSTVAVPMESYLRGVVPLESSPSWRPAALQAQAVAARTYAAQKRAAAAIGSAYDICDSTSCQVFSGSSRTSSSGSRTNYEYASTDAAIAATAGHIRTYAGKPAFTEFSASNGGFSVSGNLPYLPAKADPWDGAAANPLHSWTATLPVSALEARYPAVGTLQRLRVTKRDGGGEWGGRVLSVVLEGVDRTGRPTSVTTTGSGIGSARSWPTYSDGVRSTWWRITNGAAPAAPAAPVQTAPVQAVPALRATPVTLPPAPTLVAAPGRTGAELVTRFRNTGSSPWTLSALSLAPTSPADGVLASPLVPGAPRNLSRAGTSVLPGDEVEVRARIDAGRVVPGSYQVNYQLQAPGFVLSAPARWTVPVRAESYPANPALFATASSVEAAPVLVRPAATGTVVARFRNAGSRSWTLSAVRLGPVALRDAAYLADTTAPPATNLSRAGGTVLPGDVVEVRAKLDGSRVAVGSTRVGLRLLAPGFLLSEPVSWPVTVR